MGCVAAYKKNPVVAFSHYFLHSAKLLKMQAACFSACLRSRLLEVLVMREATPMHLDSYGLFLTFSANIKTNAFESCRNRIEIFF